jgi:hypothetical protein
MVRKGSGKTLYHILLRFVELFLIINEERNNDSFIKMDDYCRGRLTVHSYIFISITVIVDQYIYINLIY